MNNSVKERKISLFILIPLLLAIALVVALGIAFMYQSSLRKASDELYLVSKDYNTVMGQMKYPDQIEAISDEFKVATLNKLEKLANSSFAAIAQEANFKLGQYYYDTQDIEKAKTYWETLYNKSPNSLFGIKATLNLAQLYEETDDKVQALSLYVSLNNASMQNKYPYLWATAIYNQARLLEFDNKDEAIALYKQLTSKIIKGSLWVMLAENRLIALGS
jgi:tetratricopeptide (TPR) repeat protein